MFSTAVATELSLYRKEKLHEDWNCNVIETIPLNKAAVSKADVYSVNDSDVTSGILFVSLIKFYFYEA